MSKVIFSGVQPSGNLHIGNLIGALNQWRNVQEGNDALFCIVDLHAITVYQNPEELRQKIEEVAALYIACGIDPEKAHIFVQSQNPDHANLAWILNCITPFGQLERMTQFKDKSQSQADSTTAGLFDYPVLMAADILLYQTDEVPVGEDQKQHLELTRDLAEKFNSKYGQAFKLPNPVINKDVARIMSLTDPTKKMSKSDENPNSRINILDTEEEIREKIKKAVTDSGSQISRDSGSEAISNLVAIYAAFAGVSFDKAYEELEGKSYGEFKSLLADLVVQKLSDIQKKYSEVINKPEYIKEVLEKGREYAVFKSSETLINVKKLVGLVY